MAEILNLVFILSHIISINFHLTIISLGFIILGRLLRYPIEKEYTVVFKLDEKLRTMQRQAEDDSLNMISTVKYFSREDLHLGEQTDALDQFKDLSLKRTTHSSIFGFIWRTTDIIAFTISLLLLVYNFEDVNMDPGNNTE